MRTVADPRLVGKELHKGFRQLVTTRVRKDPQALD